MDRSAQHDQKHLVIKLIKRSGRQKKKAMEGKKLVTDMSNLGVLKSLVESADVESKQDGQSALQQAVISPGSDLIQMLLASGGIESSSTAPITESKNWKEVTE